ncbi:MAG: M48 family metallopeptidase [Candidatus Omnitrophota bacterium]
MSPRLKTFNHLLVFLLVLFLNGCATIYNPATQRKEYYLIGTKQEVAMGQEMDGALQEKLTMLNSPLMLIRLNRIGERIAAVSDRQDLVYTFKIVQDKELNAFAIPGGFVYVHSALMDLATDDELAGVLAHEIGHVAARHSVKRLQTALGYQIVMGIALGLSGQQDMGQALDIVFNLTTLGYGRKDELLADKLAVKYTRLAGFNPNGIVTFFEKLMKASEDKGASRVPVFLSSHPEMQERIRQVKIEIETTP